MLIAVRRVDSPECKPVVAYFNTRAEAESFLIQVNPGLDNDYEIEE